MKDFLKFQMPKKPKNRNIRLLIFLPLLLLISLCVISVIDLKLNNDVSKSALNNLNLSFSPAPYPIMSDPNNLPNISAQGAVVIDGKSNIIVYSKNSTNYFSPASTTKILTALTALDIYNPDDILTVKSGGIEGSTLGLKIGDKLRFEDLLYAMMLPSANDAAVAIAQNFPKGEEAFISLMDEKAKNYNLYSTHVIDPVGLEDNEDFTTPSDLAHLAQIAMKNPTFAKVVNTKEKNISTLQGKNFKLQNLNILLGEDGVNGVKTGYTESAGEVLVTSQRKNDNNLIIVVMDSLDRFGDTKNILDSLSKNLTYLSIHP